MTGLADWALAQADATNTPVESFDLERALDRHRAERDLFERKAESEMRGVPFRPSSGEQEVLDRLEREREARLDALPTRAQRDRARDLETANLMELELANHERSLRCADLVDGRTDATEVAINNLRAEIARLRKEQ